MKLTEKQKHYFEKPALAEMVMTLHQFGKVTKNDLFGVTSIKSYKTICTGEKILVGAGLVKTEKNGRLVFLELTPKGKRTAAAMKELADIMG